MKLVEANKEHNRRFHELPADQRVDFLLKSYSEVFATDDTQKGEFTPPKLSPESFSGKVSREERSVLYDAANNLNFLMTRFNMLGDPQYEEHVKELALLRFEYLFLMGRSELTQDPQMVVNFYFKRGKRELIRPALERMGEKATEFEHLAERIIDSPVFEEHVGENTTTYKFRTRLHTLVEDDDYSKEQAATALIDEGFDVVACDFNKWYRFETDFKLQMGDKRYRISPKETRWLADFVAKRGGQATLEERTTETPATNEAPIVPIDDDEPSEKYKCSKEGLEALDAQVKYTLKEKGDDPNFYWVKHLEALTTDHSQLNLDGANSVEAKMWDHLWGGQFIDITHQLKGANPEGKTRIGLNYNRWALLHEEHRKKIDPILAQDSYAMIIAGNILVGDLEAAVNDFNSAELQEYKNSEKIRATVNLAWEMMQHPGESDDHKNYEPPRGYLFLVAKEFQEFFKDAPSVTPYINLANANANAKLGEEEEKILDSLRGLDNLEKIYTQIGRADKIRGRFLEIFDIVYDRDTEFISILSEVRGIVSVIQNPTFRKYVDDETLRQRLHAAVQRTLERKNEYDPTSEESGSKKLVLTLYQNSVLRPYLEGSIDIRTMVNGMIDDVVDREEDLLTSPYSLRNQCDITMFSSRALEVYMLADKFREFVDVERMQSLVAYLLALNSEMTAGTSFSITSLFVDRLGEQADPNYKRPDYFPDRELKMEEQRIAFISNIYEREKKLGGIDNFKASTAVTNVIFRGNYVNPEWFYPKADSMLRFLDSPVAELLPKEGLGNDAIKEYKILHEFLRN